MKLLASAVCLQLVSARSRVTDDKIVLDAYGHTNREKVHLEDLLRPWNVTHGAPPRGWYKLRFQGEYGFDQNELIKKSGLEGRTATSFDFSVLGEEHYCRYRNVNNEQCCDREDTNCYTTAGCFCDEACYTIYGDCCQDHYVTCYDDLKLCLKKTEDQLDKPKKATNKYVEAMENEKLDARAMRHDATKPVPGHVAPNACCGVSSFNDQQDCCINENGYKSIKRGIAPCESAESEESEDERLQSPEPGIYQYDEEEY